MPTTCTDGSASASAHASSATPVPTSSTCAPGCARRSDSPAELTGDRRREQRSGRSRCTSLGDERVVVRVPPRLGRASFCRVDCLSHGTHDRLAECAAALHTQVRQPWRENEAPVRTSETPTPGVRQRRTRSYAAQPTFIAAMRSTRRSTSPSIRPRAPLGSVLDATRTASHRTCCTNPDTRPDALSRVTVEYRLGASDRADRVAANPHPARSRRDRATRVPIGDC